VDSAVQTALQRDAPDWRLRHACPACTYKLRDEQPLRFSMLLSMDGNDSLKRVVKRSTVEGDNSDETLGPSSELPTSQSVPGDRYLSREYVNKWAANTLDDAMDQVSIHWFNIGYMGSDVL
jgi:hypothetical protein